MPNAPKINEDKLNLVLNAWKTLADDKTFAGMTVAQFETAITPSFTARQQLDDLDNQRTHLINTRDDADAVSMGKVQQVVAAVVGDTNFGPDSSLYEAMGYTRKSERKSGLHRTAGSTPPAKSESS